MKPITIIEMMGESVDFSSGAVTGKSVLLSNGVVTERVEVSDDMAVALMRLALQDRKDLESADRPPDTWELVDAVGADPDGDASEGEEWDDDASGLPSL